MEKREKKGVQKDTKETERKRGKEKEIKKLGKEEKMK